MSCIFCKIINKELPSLVVAEDNDLLAIMDIQPINPGHILVIPKIHEASFTKINPIIAGKMFNLAQKIGDALKRTSSLNCEGINLFVTDGEVSGQEIFHTHLHIIPRFKMDGFGLRLPKKRSKPSEELVQIIKQNI